MALQDESLVELGCAEDRFGIVSGEECADFGEVVGFDVVE